MPVAVVRIEGHPLPTSIENDDWLVSRPSNSDDDQNRYMHKPEDNETRWRIEDPKAYEKQGRVVDVEIIRGTGFSNVSIDEDAIRHKRVFLTSDLKSNWPQVGDRVEIIKNPVAPGPWLCQTPRGRCTSATPVANPEAQSALIGDTGKVVSFSATRSARNEMLGRFVIDVPRPVKP